MDITEQTTLAEFKDGMMNAESGFDAEVQQAMIQDAKQNLENAAGAEKTILQILQNHGMPLTAENILAAKELFTNKGSLVKQVKAAGGSEKAREENTDITKQFTDFESAQRAIEAWEKSVESILEEMFTEQVETTEDIKALALGFKQLSLMSSMRKQENYHVPVELNGEMTSVNLVLVHDGEEKGTVSITMETEGFGKAGAKFRIVDNRIESYFVAESEMGKEKLQVIGKSVLVILQEKGMEIGETNYVNSYSRGRKEFDFLTFSQTDVDNNSKTVATTKLYDVAKTFLSEMQRAFA